VVPVLPAAKLLAWTFQCDGTHFRKCTFDDARISPRNQSLRL